MTLALGKGRTAPSPRMSVTLDVRAKVVPMGCWAPNRHRLSSWVHAGLGGGRVTGGELAVPMLLEFFDVGSCPASVGPGRR